MTYVDVCYLQYVDDDNKPLDLDLSKLDLESDVAEIKNTNLITKQTFSE